MEPHGRRYKRNQRHERRKCMWMIAKEVLGSGYVYGGGQRTGKKALYDCCGFVGGLINDT